MIDPRIAAGLGIGVVVLGLIAGVLWQANKLIAIGQENGTLKSENADLKEELTTKVEAVRIEIAEAERLLNECNGALTSVNFIAETWEAQYHELEGSIPDVDSAPIEIVSVGCIPALEEGRLLARTEIERILGGATHVPTQ